MSERVTSILFLAIVGLSFVGMVVGIIIAIIRRVGRSGAYKAAAARYGWTYSGNSPEAVAAVERILKPTIYTLQEGKHAVSNVISGVSAATHFQLVRYHYVSKSAHAETRRSSVNILLIFPRDAAGPEFWFMHRLKGALAAVAEWVVSSTLSVPTDPAWSWSLVSSLEAFADIGFRGGEGRTLEELTAPGDAIFFYADTIIYSSQGELVTSLAEAVAERITTLQKLLKR